MVEAKSAKHNGYSIPGMDVDLVDGLPFLHQRARRSERKPLNERLSEFDGVSGVFLDAGSPDPHFSRFPEDLAYYRQQGENFESTDAINTDDWPIPPRQHMKRKSKKLTKEELAENWGTNRKGKKKKMHKKKFIHRQNSTTVKGQPFDIVVHIKVNEI